MALGAEEGRLPVGGKYLGWICIQERQWGGRDIGKQGGAVWGGGKLGDDWFWLEDDMQIRTVGVG